MKLIYTDETGINYQSDSGYFKDGPFIIYCGVCIDDMKYFHLERLFLEIISEYFSIKDWRENEIHASDIWNGDGFFSNLDKNKAKIFFEEVIQLITKLNIEILVGISFKTFDAVNEKKQKEMAYSIYSFFHLVENHLAKNNDTGIIIADVNSCKTSEGENMFKRLFLDRIQWRSNPKTSISQIIKSKFKYESLSCFMIDNIHYVDSKSSLFIQIADIVNYIIMRVFTYEYLINKKDSSASLEKVPIPISSFKYFAGNIVNLAFFDTSSNDVSFLKLRYDHLFPDSSYLPGDLIKVFFG